jgi:valyl-tRNA synthetase
MEKAYDHKNYEGRLYKAWEEMGGFKPDNNLKGKPFSIIMPPPNANGELHLGHATFIAVSDVLIRFFRMNGSPTLWLPGIDHAGILSQVTFEKKLKKEQNKSRHDLGREEFVKQCYQFCIDNKHLMENQMKALGASCDWSREKFTLDPEVSKLVYQTFEKLYKDGLVYRGYRIVNWCPRCRSTLADVELEWVEKTDPLYYMKYGPFVLATVRPETKFGDTAVAVHPDDSRYAEYVGKEIEVDGLLGKFKIKVIADSEVNREFGTGVIKVTPGHDPLDWEIGQRHNLEVKSVIDFDGKLNDLTGPYKGLKVDEARKKVAEDLAKMGLLEKVDENYKHTVAVCERCGTVIEPLVSRQWFIKIKPLAERAIKAVEDGVVVIRPEKYQSMYFNWMRNIRDWPISRQLWWGHQLPVWYRLEDQLTEEQKGEFELLSRGDTRARTDVLESPTVSVNKPDTEGTWIQDPDTFDTWFSSGQWPVNTLKTSGDEDFKHFYPTSVMNTAYEILFLWVARMIMFGLYLTGQAPFETALINGVLRDEKGAKMSKSKGNGVNPNEAIEKYGADAVRMALVAGRDNGNDLLISKQQMEEKIRGYRNFSNKLWNIARFIKMKYSELQSPAPHYNEVTNLELTEADVQIIEKLKVLTESMTKNILGYRLGEPAEDVYRFVWHELADVYIENLKSREDGVTGLIVLRYVFLNCLKLAHPFMPFVTEALWSELKEIRQKPEEWLLLTSWPSV